MRARELFHARAGQVRDRLRGVDYPPWERVAGPVVSALSDLLGIVRAMLEIPARLALAIAEVAGEALLVAGRATIPVARRVGSAGLAALQAARRELTAARLLAAIAVGALAAIAIAEFSNYREVIVDVSPGGSDEFAPRVDERTAGSAHSNLLLPLAIGGGAVLVLAMRGRWQLARLLVVIGAATVAVCLLNDLPKGLDEGDSAVAYEGARAILLAPFWVQVIGGAVLICCGLLLPGRLREEAATRSVRSAARRPRPAPPVIVAGEDGGAARGPGT